MRDLDPQSMILCGLSGRNSNNNSVAGSGTFASVPANNNLAVKKSKSAKEKLKSSFANLSQTGGSWCPGLTGTSRGLSANTAGNGRVRGASTLCLSFTKQRSSDGEENSTQVVPGKNNGTVKANGEEEGT